MGLTKWVKLMPEGVAEGVGDLMVQGMGGTKA